MFLLKSQKKIEEKKIEEKKSLPLFPDTSTEPSAAGARRGVSNCIQTNCIQTNDDPARPAGQGLCGQILKLSMFLSLSRCCTNLTIVFHGQTNYYETNNALNTHLCLMTNRNIKGLW